MRILFLTGSLEPGKDGVGDYTRALAAECVRFGHDASMLGLNDSWVPTSVMGRAELRLGAKISWRDRIKAARLFLVQTEPEIVSLQFVPYSFHPAGLNFALAPILRAIIGRMPVHCMFHEIWVGAEAGAPAKARIFGFCQCKIIRDVINTLACRLLHTSNIVYARLLARHGIQAKLLPLFGSVPIAAFPAEIKKSDPVLSLGLFGSIHPEWNPGEMLRKLQELGRPIRASHIGRIGPGESVWERLKEQHESEIELCRLGEQSLENISRFFASLDFGVATTPLSLIGKSATVAAMLDHGLPVIVTRNDIHFLGLEDTGSISERLIPVDEAFLERLTAAQRHPPKARLPEVAAQFLRDIGA